MSKENAVEFIIKLNDDDAFRGKISNNEELKARFAEDLKAAASEAGYTPDKSEVFRDKLTKDERLMDRSVKAILTVAAAAGYTFSQEEFYQAGEELMNSELSDKDLEQVTGGLFSISTDSINNITHKIADTIINIIGQDNMNKISRFIFD